MTAVEAYEDCRRRYMVASWLIHQSDEAYKKWREQIPVFHTELSAHVEVLLRLQYTGDAEVMNALGDAFHMGLGSEKNLEEAMDRFRVASQAGHTKAMVRLGRILGREDGLNQLEEARYWYQRAAEGGYASGMVALGFVYRDGKGVPIDPVKAAEWFKKSVEAGNKGAKILLAKVYYYGLNATDKALPIFLEEAAYEKSDCYLPLGQIFSDDKSYHYDYEKAVYWFQRIVDGKYVGSANRARLELAKLHLWGKRRPKNLKTAKEWLDQVVLNSPQKNEFHKEAQRILQKIEKE